MTVGIAATLEVAWEIGRSSVRSRAESTDRTAGGTLPIGEDRWQGTPREEIVADGESSLNHFPRAQRVQFVVASVQARDACLLALTRSRARSIMLFKFDPFN
ncbi:MAG: hypothetical protein AUJ92_09880 [Armatimonadetes bacterium CG2_30_59_28]|nr:MAG: hypothetical protein AUJ92_09880 [Armatimonadetes bacterium CG2_30_59_28]PIU61224.1 MAG: hypothetical protein COS85_21390 [Armatimonadetes bacterium CG07_land_8_20_14_0_80_59_28]PIX46192.1 MAG: hypothetical protein COZ56_00040 [Armatimonadetes bacterium CG_4_8_14_3_um_filter_58_9]PIY41194.1 MAG: hypothetical protein COZ05_16090 [Armatimonadetes bacterium CG_4_10_14_3_um_filter_59_10]PJB75910.1 MAG: hypothetical protein CO095_03190 [Armatimonadetes bacterium CG_4_9_14_3_um_filter_58_7]